MSKKKEPVIILKNYKKLFAEYKDLPILQKFVLQIFAVYSNEIATSRIQNFFQSNMSLTSGKFLSAKNTYNLSFLSAVNPDDFNPINIKLANTLCTKLASRGFLNPSSGKDYWCPGNRYIIDFNLTFPILLDLYKSGQYKNLFYITQAVINREIKSSRYLDENTYFCLLTKSLLLPDNITLTKIFGIIKKYNQCNNSELMSMSLLLNRFYKNFGTPDILPSLPVSTIDLYLFILLKNAIEKMTAFPDNFESVLEMRWKLSSSFKSGNPVPCLYYEYLAIRDKQFQTQYGDTFFGKDYSYLKLLLKATQKFFNGELTLAAEEFKLAREQANKQKIKSFPRFFELIHFLCSIGTNDSNGLTWFHYQSEKFSSVTPGDLITTLPGNNIWCFLERVSQYNAVQSPKIDKFPDVHEHNPEIPYAMAVFLDAVEIYWSQNKKTGKSDAASALKLISQTLDTNSFPWFAKEALALLHSGLSRSMSEESPAYMNNQKKSQKLSTPNQNLRSDLLPLIKIQSKWDILKQLVAPKDSASAAKVEKDFLYTSRMTWRFNGYDIEPYEQLRRSDGTWTAGKKIGLPRLYSSWRKMNFLTEQDKKICSTLSFNTEYYHGYPNTNYYFNEDFFQYIIGHPLIFDAKKPDRVIEIRKGKPTLEIIKNDSQLKIHMTPFPKKEIPASTSNAADQIPNDCFQIVTVTQTQFEIVHLKRIHLEIATLITKSGLTIPAEKENEIGLFLDAVLGNFQIKTDSQISPVLDTMTSVEEVKPDTKICLHLVPEEETLTLEPLVFPLGENQQSFKPGNGIETIFGEKESRQVKTTRDFKKEMDNLQKIFDACPALDLAEKSNNTYQFTDLTTALDFLSQLHDFTDSFKKSEKTCKEITDLSGKNFDCEFFGENTPLVVKWPCRKKINISSTVSFENIKLCFAKIEDWFEASGEIQVDDQHIKLAEFMLALDKSSNRFIKMGEKEYIALSKEFKKKIEQLRSFTFADKKNVRIHPLAIPAIEQTFQEVSDQMKQFKTDAHWKKFLKNFLAAQEKSFKIPSSFKGELRDYQIEGFQWISQRAACDSGCCLADDMGLGKTIQTIALLLQRAKEGPALVVAPTSVCTNWERELERFAPSLNSIRIAAYSEFGTAASNRAIQIKNAKARDILITNYSILQIEAEHFTKKKFATIILDEAQAIKNYETGRTQTALKLQGNFRLATTGTPIENRPEDIWTLFQFLNPGFLGSRKKFEERFTIPITQDNNNASRANLRAMVRPFILRRLKSAVLEELPPKTNIRLDVELSSDEAALYEAIRKNALQQLLQMKSEASLEKKHLQILAELTRLRRLCCHPTLIVPSSKIACSKLDLFADAVQEILDGNHKALVFSQFVDYLKIIAERLNEMGVSWQYLDGSMSQKKRQQAVDAFQNGESDLFLISLKAGGFGLNLTTADYVIHMDPWWNPAVENQASDRAHRIGQKRPVTIYQMITKGTIEEKIARLHQKKESLARDLLEGTELSAKLSLEDLMALFQ